MFFDAYHGWKRIGPPRNPEIVAHFTKAAEFRNRRGTYNLIALKNMLKNPPPAFAPTDHDLIKRAISEAPPRPR